MSGSLSYPNREAGTLCSGTRKRPCSRWKRCARCNDIVARRTSARIHQDLKMLEDLWGKEEVLALTITLPGMWHGIRRSSIWSQWTYITGRQQLKGLPGLWPMRGLNKRLSEAGTVGGWHFFECTYNQGTRCWNAHLHSILLGNCAGFLDTSEVRYAEDGSKSVIGSKSSQLKELGFGERYTLDRCVDDAEVVGYCVSRAYASKQSLKGPEKELVAFLRSVKPHLVRPFGRARVPKVDRVQWLLENNMDVIADLLLSRS